MEDNTWAGSGAVLLQRSWRPVSTLQRTGLWLRPKELWGLGGAAGTRRLEPNAHRCLLSPPGRLPGGARPRDCGHRPWPHQQVAAPASYSKPGDLSQGTCVEKQRVQELRLTVHLKLLHHFFRGVGLLLFFNLVNKKKQTNPQHRGSVLEL